MRPWNFARLALFSRGRQSLVYPLLFFYLVGIRTHGISERFWLLGDQIRDWRIAMGPVTDLPLVGAPSSAGGTMLGPIYYWILWIIRVVGGPFFDNLPHAGAIGICILQSVADVFLAVALARRFDSMMLAVAVVLWAASSPYDMALTATIWNPPVAVALAKTALAVMLLQREWSLGRTCAVVVLAWLAVQAHVGAVFTAAAAIGWMLVKPFALKQPRTGFAAVRAAFEIVLLLQVPYIIHHWTTPNAASSFAAADNLAYTLRHPESLRLAESARTLGYVMSFLLFAPWSFSWFGTLLAVCGTAGAWVRRRDPSLLVASIGPLLIAVFGFAAWQGRLGEHYWYLPLIPSAAIAIALPLALPRAVWLGQVTTATALLLAIAIQPWRWQAAWEIHRMPEYGALVRGSRQIAKQVPRARAVLAPFLHPGSDPAFIYEVLGGELSPDAAVVAHIDIEGHVSYSQAR